MARPKVLPQGSERVSYFIPKPTKDALEVHCRKTNQIISDVLREAVADYAVHLQTDSEIELLGRARKTLEDWKARKPTTSTPWKPLEDVFSEIDANLAARFNGQVTEKHVIYGIPWGAGLAAIERSCKVKLSILRQLEGWESWLQEAIKNIRETVRGYIDQLAQLDPDQAQMLREFWQKMELGLTAKEDAISN